MPQRVQGLGLWRGGGFHVVGKVGMEKQHPGNRDLLRDCQLLCKQIQLTFTTHKGTYL